ncbi:MAG: regulatory protein RecX, partial [Spirochaetales bacterium]|nr:regulatory protein RecX [Spirochaetales bacterium]
LSDSSSFFITDKMILENDLESGTFLSEKQINELKSHAEYIFAKKKALELLGAREHSVYQLKQKLLMRDFDLQVVLRVLDELQDEGSLSNVRFIEAWVTSRLRKHPEGYRSLSAGLVKAGVPSDEVREYLVPFMEEIDLDRLIEEAAEKILKKNNITKDKLVRGLKNRGFDDSSIIRFIESHYYK